MGTHLINPPMTAGYLTPQRTLEITILAQLSEKQKSSQSSQVQILLKQMPAPRFPRFCFGMLCLPVSETQDTQVFMHFKGGSWLNLGKVCELEEGEEALGGTAAVVVQMGAGAQLPAGGIDGSVQGWQHRCTAAQPGTNLTSCLHGYKRQICWHFYFQPPGLDKHFLQIAHMSWGWTWGSVQGREEFKSWGWRQGLEVVMARMSHQTIQVSIANCGKQAERKQGSEEEVKCL